MSGFMDKVKYFIGIDDYEEDAYDDYDEYDYNDEPYYDEEVPVVQKSRKNNVVSLHSADSNMKIVIHEPKSYEDAPKIVDDLKLSKVVVINFENSDRTVNRKIFDFVNGALYSMEGKIQEVTKDIFIVAPKVVEISGLRDELRSKTSFPW